MRYTTLIFDFFGVISSEVSPIWFRKYFEKNDADMLREKYVIPADRGEVSFVELMDQLAALTKRPAEEIAKEWREAAAVNPRVIAFLSAIKPDYTIGLLSDAPAEYLREILKTHALEPLFDAIVISSEEGTTKRDPALYRLTLERLNASAEETLFIDDNPRNIALAESVGIRGYLFTSHETSLADLLRHIEASV